MGLLQGKHVRSTSVSFSIVCLCVVYKIYRRKLSQWGWKGLWGAWSCGRCPSYDRGVGTRKSIRFLSTQTYRFGFCDSMILFHLLSTPDSFQRLCIQLNSALMVKDLPMTVFVLLSHKLHKTTVTGARVSVSSPQISLLQLVNQSSIYQVPISRW